MEPSLCFLPYFRDDQFWWPKHPHLKPQAPECIHKVMKGSLHFTLPFVMRDAVSSGNYRFCLRPMDMKAGQNYHIYRLTSLAIYRQSNAHLVLAVGKVAAVIITTRIRSAMYAIIELRRLNIWYEVFDLNSSIGKVWIINNQLRKYTIVMRNGS